MPSSSSCESLSAATGQPGGILSVLTYDAIYDYTEQQGSMDRKAILGMLVPYDGLPMYDPAGYLISRHRELTKSDTSRTDFTPGHVVAINSSYDLGVVFSASLLRAAVEDTRHIPVVAFNASKKNRVDEYLEKARKIPVKRLTRADARSNTYLAEARERFIDRCNLLLAEMMLDGSDELKRGSHDYLGVVEILDAPDGQELRAMRRQLGGILLERFIPRRR